MNSRYRPSLNRLAATAISVFSLTVVAACGSADVSTETSETTQASAITITSPANGTELDAGRVTIKGTVTPNVPYSVTVGSVETTGESSTGDWEENISLAEGGNNISAKTEPADGGAGASSAIWVNYIPTTTTAASVSPKPKKKYKKKTCIAVPDVVGENHQSAQDEMQAAGFYMLSEEDATGQGRMLVWDRNWEVVSQSPSAGTCASENKTITLSSKKIGE